MKYTSYVDVTVDTLELVAGTGVTDTPVTEVAVEPSKIPGKVPTVVVPGSTTSHTSLPVAGVTKRVTLLVAADPFTTFFAVTVIVSPTVKGALVTKATLFVPGVALVGVCVVAEPEAGVSVTV